LRDLLQEAGNQQYVALCRLQKERQRKPPEGVCVAAFPPWRKDRMKLIDALLASNCGAAMRRNKQKSTTYVREFMGGRLRLVWGLNDVTRTRLVPSSEEQFTTWEPVHIERGTLLPELRRPGRPRKNGAA
jgi:hypothetical protein